MLGIGIGVGGAAAAATTPGGANTQVQFNNNGAFGGSAGLTYVSGSSALQLNGTTLAFGPLNIAPNGNGIIFWGASATNGAFTTNGTSGAIGVGGVFSNTQPNAQNISGCSLTAAVGGQTAGKFASGVSGACTVTITMPAAPNGWTCDAHDLTTAADANNVVQTAFTTTTATMSGTTVSGDVITWKCMGF